MMKNERKMWGRIVRILRVTQSKCLGKKKITIYKIVMYKTSSTYKTLTFARFIGEMIGK